VPAIAFMNEICALPPTRDTEMPTLMAGRTPEKNRSLSRKICPSVIEITLVGMYADTSPAWVSMIGSAVSEPPVPGTFLSSTPSPCFLRCSSAWDLPSTPTCTLPSTPLVSP
jgi:hypothetical protein